MTRLALVLSLVWCSVALADEGMNVTLDAQGNVIERNFGTSGLSQDGRQVRSLPIKHELVPAEHLRWDDVNDNGHVDAGEIRPKSIDQIQAVEDAKALQEQQHALIKQEMRRQAIKALKQRQQLPEDYPE